jgi:hypothetical protein
MTLCDHVWQSFFCSYYALMDDYADKVHEALMDAQQVLGVSNENCSTFFENSSVRMGLG